MLIARAATIATTSRDMIDSIIMNIRARVDNGNVSVGLNAVAVVNEERRSQGSSWGGQPAVHPAVEKRTRLIRATLLRLGRTSLAMARGCGSGMRCGEAVV